jgi:integrase
MSRTSERRKKRRKTRRIRSKGAPAAYSREPMATCAPSPEAGPPTRSAQLTFAEATAALFDEANGMVGIAPTMRLDPEEQLPEAAPVPGVDARDDGALLPSLAHGLWDPILELRPDNVGRSLARLPPSSHADVLDLARLFRVYERAATPITTRRLYLNRLTLFASWCAARGARAMPADPEVLRLYLVSLADENKALSTLDVSVAAITMAHRALGHAPPMSDELRVTLRSLRRTLGPARTYPTPISVALLRQIVASCDDGPHGIRDRALILVTYFAGLRRAETAGLNREGVHREERGYRLTLDSAQRDPTDAPPPLASHAEPNLCPVLALKVWLDTRAMWTCGGERWATHGPVFVALPRGGPRRVHLGDRLAPSDVDRIVKRRAVAAGLNPAGLSAVSVGAGFYAELARYEASPEEIRDHVALEATSRFLCAKEALVPPTPPRSPT